MVSSKWCRILVLGLFLITLLLAPSLAGETRPTDPLRIGIFTDLHAHDTDSPGEGKVMTNYGERLQAFVKAMNAWPAELVIQLGNFVNGKFVLGAPQGEAERIVGILEDAERIYTGLLMPRYYVLGNHDVYDLAKEEFLARVGAEWTYGSFDAGAYHVVLLDAQYNKTRRS